MYASPVIFPLSIVPEGSTLRTVIEWNPMTGVIEGFRSVLLGTPLQGDLLPWSAGVAMFLLLVGAAVFQRAQRSFADVV
jgi:ABC-type polysaccharide/polyol phosphate export permease